MKNQWDKNIIIWFFRAIDVIWRYAVNLFICASYTCNALIKALAPTSGNR